jgi:hypothetical protein
MNTCKRTLLASALAVAAGAMLSACIVAPAQPYYAGGYEGGYYDGVVAVAPPAPQYEVIGVAPGPGYFWIGGYWGWRGGRHVWFDGRWEHSRPGYRYEPHGWQRGPQGWREAPGHWRPMN